ncbi:serine-rich adhesin for platelets [Anabrus simplex]|uniref:serine-rich adhesin for platelets n=1 Tax=Anabrus simplex TaxID=316456 RepID=UPI0035A3BE13
MPKKENSSKSKEWERERRQRLNTCFKHLGTLLPNYDPSVTASKIDVLQKAAAYIQDLEKGNKELVKGGNNKCYCEYFYLRSVYNCSYMMQLVLGISPVIWQEFKLYEQMFDVDMLPAFREISLRDLNFKDDPGDQDTGKCCKFNFMNAAVKTLAFSMIAQSLSGSLFVSPTPMKIAAPKAAVAPVSNAPKRRQVQHLKQRVNELVKRTQQLTALLRDAGITVPTELQPEGRPLGQRPLKWTNKLKHEDATSAQEKLKNKTVVKKRLMKLKMAPKSELKAVQNKVSVSELTEQQAVDALSTSPVGRIPTKEGKLPKDLEKKAKVKKRTTSVVVGADVPVSAHDRSARTTLLNTGPQLPPGFIVLHGTNPVLTTSTARQPCIVVASNTQNAKKTATPTFGPQPIPLVLSNNSSNIGVCPQVKQNGLVAMTNSHLLTAPIMATGIQTCPPPAVLANPGTGLAGLGPGTLILANGSIVPILPQSQAVPPTQTAQFVVNPNHMPTPPRQSLILMQNSVTATTSATFSQPHSYPLCLPKPINRQGIDSTKTTFANKVPIPALSSRNHPKPCISTSQSISSIKSAVNKVHSKPDHSNKLNGKFSFSKKLVTHMTVKSNKNKITAKLTTSNLQQGCDSSKDVEISQTEDIESVACSNEKSDLSAGNLPECDISSEIGPSEEHETPEAKYSGNSYPDDHVEACDENHLESLEEDKCSHSSVCDTGKKRKHDDGSQIMDVGKRLKGGESKERNENESAPTSLNDDVEGSNFQGSKIGSSGNYSIDALCNKTKVLEKFDQNLDHSVEDKIVVEENNLNCQNSSEKVCEVRKSLSKEDQDVEHSAVETEGTSLTGSSLSITGSEMPINVAGNMSETEVKSGPSTIDNSVQNVDVGNCSVETSVPCTEKLLIRSSVTETNNANSLSDKSELLSHAALERDKAPLMQEEILNSRTLSLKPDESSDIGYPDGSMEDPEVFPKNSATDTSPKEKDNLVDSVKALTHSCTSDTSPSQSNNFALVTTSNSYSSYSLVLHNSINTFIPISNSSENESSKNVDGPESSIANNSTLGISLPNSEFSSDLFATLQVPSGVQHSESISPTAAFLLAFPLVSTSKVSEMMVDNQEDVGSDSMQGTSTLLQIGNISSDPTNSETITCIERSEFRDISGAAKISSVPSESTSSANCNEKDFGQTMQTLESSHSCRSFESSQADKALSSNASQNTGKPAVNLDIPEELPKSGIKSWMDIEISSASSSGNNDNRAVDGKLKFTSRSVGTQAYSENTFTASDCSDNKLMSSSGKNVNLNECKEGATSCLNNPASSRALTSDMSTFKVTRLDSESYGTSGIAKKPHLCTLEDPMGLPADASHKLHRPDIGSSSLPPLQQDITELKRSTPSAKQQSFPIKAMHDGGKNALEIYPSSVEPHDTMTNAIRHETSDSASLKSDMQSAASRRSNVMQMKYVCPTTCASSAYSQPSVTINSFNNNYFNDYPVIASSCYSQAGGDHCKSSAASSFSLAHNSSNLSILSWSTLSPMATVSNANQCEYFSSVSNSVANIPQTFVSPSKYVTSQKGSMGTTVVVTASPDLSANCQHEKSVASLNSVISHPMHKPPSPFTNNMFVNGSEEIPTSHLEFQNSNNVHTTVAQASSDVHFKFPSAADEKLHQVSRQNGPFQSEKHSHHEQQQVHRPPVNWMTAPDIRSCQSSVFPPSSTVNTFSTNSVMSTSVTSTDSLQSSKDFEFCSNSHNLLLTNPGSNLPPFDSRHFTNNGFYGAHNTTSNSLSCQTSESSHHNAKSVQHRQTERILEQNQSSESYNLSWSQRKAAPIMPTDINNSVFVPSTLPTLVGDLALGTNYPLPLTDDSTANKPFHLTNFNESDTDRKGGMSLSVNEHQREPTGKQIEARQTEKNADVGTKVRNNSRNSSHDYRNSNQSSSSSFLSVSQLVDQAKSAASSSRGQTSMVRRSSHSNRQPLGTSKHNNTSHHQQQVVSSNNADINKGLSSHRGIEKETNRKQQQSNIVNFSSGEMSLSHINEREPGKGSDIPLPNNHYNSALPQSASGFSVSFNNQDTQPPVTSNNTNWPVASGMLKHTNARAASSTYKAPVSSYSAEALIGLNNTQSDEGTSSLILDGPSSKVISLPPPMVTERFCHQNYPHHQVSRSLQIPPPFNTDTVLPGNYFGSVDLPVPHSQDGNPASMSNNHNNFSQHSHQDQQSYNNNTFNYPKPSSASGQGSGSLYPTSNFMPTVGNTSSNSTLPPVSISGSFLTDIETSNPFIFPPSTISKGSSCHRTGSKSRNSLSYGHALVPSVPPPYHRTRLHLPSRNDGSSNSVNSSLPFANGNSNNRRVSGTGINNSSHHQTSNINAGNCTLNKQRNRRRIPDPVISTTTSGVSGFVDLSYLAMPPGIGSPLLTDDGVYVNHSGTFLTPSSQHSGSSVYTGGPAASQGSLYSQPCPPVQTNSSHGPHHSNYLPPFSSCNTTLNTLSVTRTPQQQQQQQQQQQHPTASPNATNSSGTTLTNFNLSTIFPEINDKVAPTPGGKNLVTPPRGHRSAAADVSEFPRRQAITSEASACLPPPVPLHSNVNFNNILAPTAPQVCRMQWP